MNRGVFSCMSGNIVSSTISDSSRLQISRKYSQSVDEEESFKHSVLMNVFYQMELKFQQALDSDYPIDGGVVSACISLIAT